jgi:hypothetical protein
MRLSRIYGAWSLIAVFAAAQAIVWTLANGRRDLLVSAVAGNLLFVTIWALMTPVLFKAVARYPVRQHVAGYASAFAVFFIGTNAIVRLPFVFTRGWSWFGRGLLSTLSEYVVPASLAFAALVAIGHWLASRRDTAPTHVSIADRGQTFRVPVEAIHWIQAEDNYVLIHTPARTYTARERISDLESRLDQRRFARVHRSTIVNLSIISAVKPLSHGDYEVVLSCGTSVRGSRSRRAVLDRLR